MHPQTVQLVKLADCGIKMWHKNAFRNFTCALLNFGLAVVNGVNSYVFWGSNNFLFVDWVLLCLIPVSLFAGTTGVKTTRDCRRRERHWRNIRHCVMQVDASDNVSRAVLYMDQVEASLRDL